MRGDGKTVYHSWRPSRSTGFRQWKLSGAADAALERLIAGGMEQAARTLSCSVNTLDKLRHGGYGQRPTVEKIEELLMGTKAREQVGV